MLADFDKTISYKSCAANRDSFAQIFLVLGLMDKFLVEFLLPMSGSLNNLGLMNAQCEKMLDHIPKYFGLQAPYLPNQIRFRLAAADALS